LDNPERVTDWLYANYTVFMRQTNGRPIGQRRYTKLLEDLCCSQLKIPGVKRGRDRYGSFFTGLKIRTQGDTDPRPITGDEPPEPPDTPPPTDYPTVTDNLGNCDEFVTAETVASDGCDGCDAFFEVNQENENFSVEEADLEPTVAEFHPSHAPITSITTHHNPSQPSQGFDYSTFPHRASDNIQAKRNLANKVKEELLVATSKEELTAVKQTHGQNQINWVWRHLLTQGEREKLRTVTQTEQLNLLSLAPDMPQAEASNQEAQVAPVVFAPGDKVLHAEFGEGIVEQQLRDMVFCRFACGKRSPWVWDVHPR
jgi:putative DNA primase/helicase